VLAIHAAAIAEAAKNFGKKGSWVALEFDNM
jgi:hypothetical protein